MNSEKINVIYYTFTYTYQVYDRTLFYLQFHEGTTPKSQDTTAKMEVIKVQEEDKVFKPKQ